MRSCFCSLAGIATLTLGAAQAACPPEGFTSKQPFNARDYFQGTWYTLRQVPVAFQPTTNLFCVSGALELSDPQGDGDATSLVLRVRNGASVGGVAGPRSTAELNGTIPDLAVPSQALVGPRAGAYWVIEAGAYAELTDEALPPTAFTSDHYEWAIVSGGAPVAQSANGCLPGVGPTNAKGFWLLSREPVVAADVVDKIARVAAAKGFDVSALVTIPQAGCSYIA